MDRVTVLAQANFFKELSEDSRRALADITIPRNVKKHTLLFAEGDKGHSVYLLNRGDIQLYKTTPDGAEVVIKLVRPGEVFAETVLFERERYPVSALTLSDSMVYLFPCHDIHHLLSREDFRNDFIAMLMRKQRYLTERIVDLTGRNVGDRLFRFFREHFEGQKTIRLPMSKKEVAAAIGATPETLSRLIQKLEHTGVLTWKGKEIRLVNPPAME